MRKTIKEREKLDYLRNLKFLNLKIYKRESSLTKVIKGLPEKAWT